MNENLDKAAHYAGNFGELWSLAGNCQLDLLKRIGLTPSSKVAEVGCGCLSAGAPLIRYLEDSTYIGIDPNRWLIEAAIEDNLDLMFKHPTFAYNDDFSIPREVDFVISHSVLSHAAYWQLNQFFANVKPALAPGGKILASIRLAEQNSMHETWQYPDNSFFSWSTVENTAAQNDLKVEERKDFREYMTSICPSNFHDWFIATH